jgi:hypothetical protein
LNKQQVINFLRLKANQDQNPLRKQELFDAANSIEFDDVSKVAVHIKNLPRHVRELLASYGLRLRQYESKDRCSYGRRGGHDWDDFQLCPICTSNKIVKYLEISWPNDN